MAKKRLVKDYDKLPKDILQQVKIEYPNGFAHKLLMYTGQKGEKVSALPFETEDVYYLIRMTVQEARQIIRDDEDYDDDGKLRDDFVLDGLDVDGLDTEGESTTSVKSSRTSSRVEEEDDDDDDEFVTRRTRRSRDDDDGDDDDY